MGQRHVLLFGDHITEPLNNIKVLYREAKKSSLLSRFLQEAADIIKTQAVKLGDFTGRQRLLDATDFVQLAENEAKLDYEHSDIIWSVLVSITRLSELILHAENDPSILGTPTAPIHVVGLCTGAVAAIAAVIAKDITELSRVSVELSAANFRLAVALSERSRAVEDAPGVWGYIVTGIPASRQQALLDEFHSSQKIPNHRQAYLSVIANEWTTLSGPPSVLEKLWAHSEPFSQTGKLPLRLRLAGHARHLPLLDYETIIGDSTLYDMPIPSKAIMRRTESGEAYSSSNLRTLMREVLEDIGQNPLLLNHTVEAVAADVPRGSSVKVTVIGPTKHTVYLTRALQAHRVKLTVQEAAEVIPIEKPRDGSGLVAIVGIAGRFPGGDNLKEFWQTIENGLAQHKEIPKERFDISTFFDSDGTKHNGVGSKYGCFMDRPGQFDSRLFNVSSREAAQMDPLQRLTLMASYEALEMAGYAPNNSLSSESTRCATFFGQATEDQKDICHIQGIDIYYVPGVLRAFAPGRLNHYYKWEGPSYSLDTACSSSTSAVLLACNALLDRDIDTAVAGGGSILNSPAAYSGLSKGGFLSTTGGCKTFRDDADGYCRGESIGLVVLKRYEDAIADNDNIQAVIRASARNYCAQTSSITHPHAPTQQRLYEQLLRKACLEPSDIGYVEFHGTATQAGDKAEMTSILSVFGEGRTAENPLHIGAVKANIGHGEASAGISSLIKSVLILREGTVPAQAGMPHKTNPNYPDLEKLNVRIPSKALEFKARPKGDGKRKILVNSFDAAGGNTSLIIEDPPNKPPKHDDPRSWHLISCSGRTQTSLKKNKERLLDYIASHPEAKLSDIAYTTTARRMHEIYRSTYIGKSTQELAGHLQADISSGKDVKRVANSTPVVFAFTGQGSPYAGMGSELYNTSPTFRGSVHRSQQLCDSLGLPSFVDIIADPKTEMSTKSAAQIQLALVALELSLADLWSSWGIEPTLVIGHSLGEYAALCVSGVLSRSDTLHLVGRRAVLMQKKCSAGTHGMIAAKASADQLEQVIQASDLKDCEVCCKNAPESCSVSGPIDQLEKLQEQLQGAGIPGKRLELSFAFHSAQMDPILTDLAELAKGINFAKPTVPVASAHKGIVVFDRGVFSAKYLVEQTRGVVNFTGALGAAASQKLVDDKTLYLELGPTPVCHGMIQASLNVPMMRLLPSLKGTDQNWKTLMASLATIHTTGVAVNFTGLHREYINSVSLLELPTYAFDLQDFWKPFVDHCYNSKGLPVAPTSSADSVSYMPGFPTVTLQRVEQETIQDGNTSVMFSTQTAEPRLYEAIQGHKMIGSPLCPAGIFGDMAFSAAKYIHMKINPGKEVPAMSLEALQMSHPLVVARVNPQQVVYISAKQDTKAADTIQIKFTAKDGGSTTTSLGTCKVVFGNSTEWQAEWSKSAHLIKSRIDALESGRSPNVHHLLKPMVYKLFGNVVQYGDKYQTFKEVYLDNEHGDAAGEIQLPDMTGTGEFTHNPYFLDAIGHLGGFVLNGNVTTPEGFAFLCDEVDSLRVAGHLIDGKSYKNYAYVRAGAKKGTFISDLYTLDGDQVVAEYCGLKFQMMPRNTLEIILGQPASGPPRSTQSSSRAIPSAPGSSTSGSSADLATLKSDDEGGANTPASSVGGSDENVDIFLNAIAAETGCSPDEMDGDTQFGDLGVDSLMSIAIMNNYKKATGDELPASFLITNPTVADVRKALGKGDAPATHTPSDTPNGTRAVSPSPDDGLELKSNKPNGVPQTNGEIHPSLVGKTSRLVLMHGNPQSKETPLFLICDGSGAAASYIHLASFPSGRPIWGLDSPFLNCPAEFKCSIEQISDVFYDVIRKAQPKGPYMIGGWSAGGAFAYEVCRRLLIEGERVSGLLILDLQRPRRIPDSVPDPPMEVIEMFGMDQGIARNFPALSNMTRNLKGHLLSTLQRMVRYDPIPMAPDLRPEHICIIWARKGLNEVAAEKKHINLADFGIPEADQEEVHMFFEDRKDLGPCGWQTLFGTENLECHSVDANHFSMVIPPAIAETSRHVHKAVDKFINGKP